MSLSDIPVVVVNDESFVSPSVPADITKQLLESKRPPVAEIELTLFENCNIVCDFCHHDKKSTTGMSMTEMMSKIDIIEEFMKERQGTVEMLQINIVGGELFQDRYMEHLTDCYIVIASTLARKAEEYGYDKFRIVWVSNFLFTKRVMIKGMVDYLRERGVDNHLIVSYDFDGRPMSNRYRENIEWFGPGYIISVNCVGTVPAIENFMKNDDDFFKWLYKTFNTYFDDYIPDKGYSYLIPPDSLLYKWYKFIADNYPKMAPVKDLIDDEHNSMHCLSLNKLTIFPDNSTANCRWDRYDQSDFGTEYNRDDNAGMMQRFLDDNGCLSCEYFNRCGFRCYTQWDWRERVRDMNICPMKAFHNYVTKGIEWESSQT